MKTKKVAKIILLNEKNEILLQLRDNIPSIVCPGQWALIGGEINSKETPMQGLKREIEEEIPDCEVKDIKFIGNGYVEIDFKKLIIVGYSIYDAYKNKNNKNLLGHIHIFKGTINEEIEHINKKLTEGQKAEFFNLQELKNLKKLNNFVRDFIYENKEKIFSKTYI